VIEVGGRHRFRSGWFDKCTATGSSVEFQRLR